MITITKQYRAEIAHRLPDHPGRCRFIHGHSYLFEIEVARMSETHAVGEHGMVMDFSILKTLIDDVIQPLDHSLVLFRGDPLISAIENLSAVRLFLVPFI